MQELLALLQEAGHSDFRDARGPMGFNQRQAAGKFSRDEATAFIEQLQREAELAGQPAADQVAPTPASRPAVPKTRPSATEQALAKIPTPQLAAELQRRGWIVVEP